MFARLVRFIDFSGHTENLQQLTWLCVFRHDHPFGISSLVEQDISRLTYNVILFVQGAENQLYSVFVGLLLAPYEVLHLSCTTYATAI